MINRRNFLTLLGLGFLTSVSPVFITACITKAHHQEPSDFSVIDDSKSLFFYVAPNGNDSWSGRLSKPNKKRTDGPFATLTRVRNYIRKIKREQDGTLRQPVIVFLRGGTYFLPETLEFTAEDSGTKDFPITYKAYRHEKPVISGGKRITGWKQVRMDGKKIWAAELPEEKEGEWFFRQLWINGNRCIRARYPNKGYLKVNSIPDVKSDTQWYQGQTGFRYSKGDLKNWQTVDRAEIVLTTGWRESRLPVTSVDDDQRIVSFDRSSSLRINPQDLYYIEHALEILDSPGEWYLDQSQGKLYYMPLPGEDIQKVEAIAPVLSRLVNLQANWKLGQFVEHLFFENLTFAHAEWYYPKQSKGSGTGQAANIVPGAIYSKGVRHCAWKNCAIAHVSNYGIEFSDVCEHNRVMNCEIFDLGAGGVKIRTNGKHKIINCHIHNGGLMFHSAVGILITLSSGNYIANNHIHDFYYTGISIGWTWGYDTSPTKNNVIESNYIHHIGKLSNGDGPLLNDKGGIYTLGVQPGTIIRANVIHDIQAFNYGAWGIYLDEGSSQILVEKNLVYRTRDGGFHLHYGKENTVRNNIFAFGSVAQIRSSSAAGNHVRFVFDHNIIYWNEGKLLEGKWVHLKSYFAFDRNLYWYIGTEDNNNKIDFDNRSWNEWQTKGMDRNSLIADPLFINPEKGDFRLKPNSPALKLGFKPLPALSSHQANVDSIDYKLW